MNLKEKAKQIKKNLAALFVALTKKETPWYAKVIAGITVGYALSPIDLIPDFIPVLGYLDDIIILPLLILLSIKLIPQNIMKQALSEAQGLWEKGKIKKWYFAIPIVSIWLLVVVIIVRKVF